MNVMKRISVILLVLLSQILFSSCQKEKGCDVKNPKKDLPWLKEMIENYEDKAKVGEKVHAKIYQCTYRDGIGFLLETGGNQYPQFSSLINCEGECLCTIGGVAGNQCREFNISKKQKLIWSIKKNINH